MGLIESMLDDIAALGDDLSRSYAAAGAALAARPAPLEPPAGVCVCALGGSAIGGDLAESLWRDGLRAPLVINRAGDLPGWVRPGAERPSLVVAVSYSGGTAETVACAEQALERGVPLVAVTAGGPLAALAAAAGATVVPVEPGLLPRIALGRMFAGLAAVLERAGVVAPVGDDIAAAVLGSEAGAVAGRDEPARALGAALATRTTWLYGAGPLGAVARRWKTQLNENGKVAASSLSLPEADHNEVVGWERAALAGEHAAIFLTDPDDPPRIAASVASTRRLIGDSASVCEVLEGVGATRTARAFWLIAYGDCVSTHAAGEAGIDPYAIARIAELKRDLAAAER